MRWMIHLLEQSIQKLELKPDGVSSLLQISDFNNSPPPSKKELRTAMKQAVGILQDNYPD
ncbi:PATL5 [Linum perenne]